MATDIVTYDVAKGVATIQLNSEVTRNAMSVKMSAALNECLADARRSEEVRSILITGSGKTFCAGGDVKQFNEGWTANSAHAYLRDGMLWAKAIVECPKPVIAAVNGHAFGAGLSLALVCDVIIASANAKFCTAFTRVGLIADCGSGYWLTRIVGLVRAKELIFSSRVFLADEAAELGIAAEVVPESELVARAREVAELWAAGPTVALGLMKDLLNRSSHLSFNDYLSLEAKAQAICFNTEDHAEGVRGFLEKRATCFRGK